MASLALSYLQLAHSERHPVTGVPSAKVIHNFGRADTVERVLFALVAQRALEPGSKLAATRWVAERVAIAGCGGFPTTRRIGRWTSCSARWARSPRGSSARSRTNLDVDIVFVDTTSTYWQVDVPDELYDLQPEPEVDDGAGKPVEHAARRFGKSKDHRDDVPQV